MGANISRCPNLSRNKLSDDAYLCDGDVYYDCNDDPPVDWLQLPDDLMKLIIQRLDVTDRLRICSVCKSWRFLATQRHVPLPPQFPWLMLSPTKSKTNRTRLFPWSDDRSTCKQITFFDTVQGKIHNLELPKSLEGGWCFGSSKGWLFIAKGGKKEPQVFLLNPISKHILGLPSITTIPSYYNYLESLEHPYDFSSFIYKLDICVSEDASQQCTIVAILNTGEVLASCKPEDAKWTILFQLLGPEDTNHMFMHMSFYKGTLYVLYALDVRYKDKVDIVPDFNSGVSKCSVPIKLMFHGPIDLGHAEDVQTEYDLKGAHAMESINSSGMADSFLVESRGELLRICVVDETVEIRIEDEYEDGIGVIRNFKRRRFEVYKMDNSNGRLDDDQVLFVGGKGSSVSLSVKDFNGVKGNCIHLLDDIDYENYSDFDPFVARESGIFRFVDGKIRRNYPALDYHNHYPAHVTWFTPHINFTSI
ncbi:conserved hypothetical protein [Ricinus communis]|uniref:F-box domain-containing protein n=1 Tax=Ricinus communis TaxID=3988 RepID=B9RF28_RICCO|nr:conserved hypothetical protein [Ricinus communis]